MMTKNPHQMETPHPAQLVMLEQRVRHLQGALRDQDQILAERTRERDRARHEAAEALRALDEIWANVLTAELQRAIHHCGTSKPDRTCKGGAL